MSCRKVLPVGSRYRPGRSIRCSPRRVQSCNCLRPTSDSPARYRWRRKPWPRIRQSSCSCTSWHLLSVSLSNLDERCAQTKSKSESRSMIWLTLPAPGLMAHEGACRSAHLGCAGALRQLLEKAAVAAYLLDRLCLTHNGPRGSLRLQSELQACFWFTE